MSARPSAARRSATTAAAPSASSVPCPRGSSRASSSSAARETASTPRNGGRESSAAAAAVAAGRLVEPDLVRPPDTRSLRVDRRLAGSRVADHRVPAGAGKVGDDRRDPQRNLPAADRERERSALAAGKDAEPRRHEDRGRRRVRRLASPHTGVALLRDPVAELGAARQPVAPRLPPRRSSRRSARPAGFSRSRPASAWPASAPRSAGAAARARARRGCHLEAAAEVPDRSWSTTAARAAEVERPCSASRRRDGGPQRDEARPRLEREPGAEPDARRAGPGRWRHGRRRATRRSGRRSRPASRAPGRSAPTAGRAR